MAKVDEIYDNLVKKIYNDGSWNKNHDVRTVYADKTKAHAKSVFGVQVEFRNGIIPALTKKKLFWKTALKEMQLFWVKQTVQENDFKADKVKVWDEWFINGNLGRSYAYQFESHRHVQKEIVKVERKTKQHHGELKPVIVNETQEPNWNNKHKNIGKIMQSKNYGEFKILDWFPQHEYYSDEPAYKIQFLETDYITIARARNVTRQIVTDPYVRNVCGVGYEGNVESVKNYTNEEIKTLRLKWRHMLDRCYKSATEKFHNYGGKGVFVDERWHSFENFLRDVRHIPQFFLAKEQSFKKWELDKDWHGSNCYSKETCVFLSQKENFLYRNFVKPFKAFFNDGTTKIFLAHTEMAKEYDLSKGAIKDWLDGRNEGYKKYDIEKFEYIEDDEHVYRYEVSRNQVVDLINNIKNSPSSRRLMTSFWNDADVNKKALQECAWATDFNVRDIYLDLILIQRSGDIGLGIPFNWIQYWFLQNMIAHVCNLKAGDFIHQIGNLHYYDRHEQSLMKQIENDEYEEPQLWLNENVKDFFDFTADDVKLLNYKSGEYIPMEVAI